MIARRTDRLRSLFTKRVLIVLALTIALAALVGPPLAATLERTEAYDRAACKPGSPAARAYEKERQAGNDLTAMFMTCHGQAEEMGLITEPVKPAVRHAG